MLALMPDMEQFNQLVLYDEPLELALSDKHAWSNQRHISLQELSGEHVLMLADGHCLRDQALGFCFAAGAIEDNSFKATSLETLRHMISAENGVTLLPQLAIPLNRNQAGVKYIPFEPPVPSRQIVLLSRNNSARQACFDKLAEVINRAVQTRLDEYA